MTSEFSLLGGSEGGAGAFSVLQGFLVRPLLYRTLARWDTQHISILRIALAVHEVGEFAILSELRN